MFPLIHASHTWLVAQHCISSVTLHGHGASTLLYRRSGAVAQCTHTKSICTHVKSLYDTVLCSLLQPELTNQLYEIDNRRTTDHSVSPNRSQSRILRLPTLRSHHSSTVFLSAGPVPSSELRFTFTLQTKSAFFEVPVDAFSIQTRHSATPMNTSSGVSSSCPARGAPVGL